MTRFSCCEVCDRNPTCGLDCGSCEGPPEEMATLAVRGSYPHGSTINRAADLLAELIREDADGSR